MRRQFVPSRFQKLIATLPPSGREVKAGRRLAARAIRELRAAYRAPLGAAYNDSYLLGPFGKEVALRPLRRIDLLYRLPPGLARDFGHDAECLLAHMAGVLASRFGAAAAAADGSAVVVPAARFSLRLVPGIEAGGGGFLVPEGGDWALINPLAEAIRIRAVDCATAHKASHLIRLTAAWRRHAEAPIEPLPLEVLATDFVAQWAFRYGDTFFYDWMVRDFLGWLRSRAGTALVIPGRNRPVALGRAWAFHAESAHRAARRACGADRSRDLRTAAAAWREVFGPIFPQPSTPYLAAAHLHAAWSLDGQAIAHWQARVRRAARLGKTGSSAAAAASFDPSRGLDSDQGFEVVRRPPRAPGLAVIRGGRKA